MVGAIGTFPAHNKIEKMTFMQIVSDSKCKQTENS